MLRVGDYVGLKSNLVLGRKYGTVTFSKYHVPYLRKVLRVYNISSANTAYCNHKGDPCQCGTISEPMLNIAKLHVGDAVRIVGSPSNEQSPYIGNISKIKSIEYKEDHFLYHIVDDCGFFEWPEHMLEFLPVEKKEEEFDVHKMIEETVDEVLSNHNLISKNENRLQEESPYFRRGERIKGNRVHGWSRKASVRSRPLRDPKGIRGK